MEIWEVWITLKVWWFLKYRNIEIEEDKKSWASPIAAIGLIIIVVGILLETYCEGKVSDAESELRNHLSDKITAAENAASDSDSKAADAEVRAEQLEAKAAGLRKDADTSKLETAQLNAQVAPRRLSQAQIEAIRSSCLSFSGKTVTVSSYALDVESEILASQLIGAIRGGGVNVQDATGSTSPVGGFSKGISVSGKDANLVAGLKYALVRKAKLALTSDDSKPTEGMKVRYVHADQVDSDAEILVGAKPIK